MNRVDVERYACIAQVIDDAEKIVGVDFYNFKAVKIEQSGTDKDMYDVKVEGENVELTITFYREDRDIKVELLESNGCCVILYTVEYDENHHIRLIEV